MTESATPIDRSKAEFVDLAADAEKPAVVRASASLDADVTPLAAYATLVGEGPYGFLLESGEKVASSDPDGAFTRRTATSTNTPGTRSSATTPRRSSRSTRTDGRT